MVGVFIFGKNIPNLLLVSRPRTLALGRRWESRIGPGTSTRQGRFYACSYNRKRGSSIRKNCTMAAQDVLDQALLKGLADVLHEQVINDAIEQALRHLRKSHDGKLDRTTAIQWELSLITSYEERLVDAIKKGHGDADALVSSLAKESARKKELAAELVQLQHAETTRLDATRLRHEIKQRVADLPTLLGSHVSEARKLLKLLFENGLKADGDGSTFRVTGTGDFGRLLPGSSVPSTWCPQRDSNPCCRLERPAS